VKKNDQNTRKNSNKTPSNWLSNSGTIARRLAGDLALPLPNVSRWVREYRQDQQDLSDNGITRK
jgi:hypothetical protein